MTENKLVGSDKLTFNKLKVPYGKRFDVIFSDGTHVFLNSGSILKYPVSFIEEGPRQVFLSGGAYFEVSHDPENSFLVGTQELNVRVYGTKFTVSNYASDNDMDVVLVEGGVPLETKESRPTIMNNSSQGLRRLLIKQETHFRLKKLTKSSLVFRNTPFTTIVKRPERQYNVVIINNNEQLGKETFNATFETKRESLQQVFDYFDKFYNIDYQFFKNKVIIG